MAPNLIPSFPSSTPAGVSCANSHCVTKTLAPGRERRRQSDRVFFFLEARARKSRPRLSVPEGGFGSRCLDHHPPPPFNSLFGVRSKIFLPPPPWHGSSAFAPALFFQFLAFFITPPPSFFLPFLPFARAFAQSGHCGGSKRRKSKETKNRGNAATSTAKERGGGGGKGMYGEGEFLCLLLLCLWFFVPCTWIRRAIGHYSDPANLVLIETSFLIACGLTRQVLLVRQDKPPGM